MWQLKLKTKSLGKGKWEHRIIDENDNNKEHLVLVNKQTKRQFKGTLWELDLDIQ